MKDSTMTTLADAIASWIREKVERASASGIAVGLSGGIDSAVVAGLATRGLGADRVTGVIMPAYSQPEDVQDAQLVAQTFGIDPVLINLSQVFDVLIQTLPPGSELAAANIKPRLRMISLYHIANTNNLLVSGTGNRSELMAGYFTKYGDGGVDILPLGSLYKRDVRAIAADIGVPQRIIDRKPSAGLWAGQTDEAEMGISYENLDGILDALDRGDVSDYPDDLVKKVQRMIATSGHKRQMPPIFELSQPLSMLERA
jgi:NAD+ synthase